MIYLINGKNVARFPRYNLRDETGSLYRLTIKDNPTNVNKTITIPLADQEVVGDYVNITFTITTNPLSEDLANGIVYLEPLEYLIDLESFVDTTYEVQYKVLGKFYAPKPNYTTA